MRPSEQIARLRRDLQLCRQESMDLRVALVLLIEVLESSTVDLPVSEGFKLLAVIRKARVALGVANPKPERAKP